MALSQSFQDKVFEFVTKPSFRSVNLFPSRENYNIFVRILQCEKIPSCNTDVKRTFCVLVRDQNISYATNLIKRRSCALRISLLFWINTTIKR